jgi:uncharacterized protein (TIGR01777 family)
MNILVSGSTGFIGKAIVSALTQAGHQVVPLRRATKPSGPDLPVWAPIRNDSWESEIGPVDAVIHLAGENLASHRWTPEVKRRLRESRTLATEQLARRIASLSNRPNVFISASAIGYYGNRGDELLTEESSCGDGFLSELCRDWEAACGPARDAGMRVVNLRFGMVLGRDGGALAKQLTIFKLGLGGRFGSGQQWTSWVSLDDLAAAVMFVLNKSSLSGPVNVVSPNPVTNIDFTRTLGRVVRRPSFCAVPSFVLRVTLGEMADEMLLSSARVLPKRLTDNGFRFQYAELETALRRAVFH